MELTIELGQKACKNIEPTKEGYTHDWTVFVQGVTGKEIKHVVEKVIFHLPDTYPDPHRVKEKPPYSVSESSSQGLSVGIDVLFCPEAKLKKVHYVYDVFISDEVLNVSWEKKLQFPNPSEEFKKKLNLAGGELVDLLDAFPVMTGEVVKIKEEPVDEVENVNNVDTTVPDANIAVPQINNLQNNCCSNNQRELDLNKLLEENKNLKKANLEIKEKIEVQEKLMAEYEETFSQYETNILNTNSDIDRLKKKVETEAKEISTLELQYQMCQVKSKISAIENSRQVLPGNRMRGTKRKNEDMNISSADGKGKENVIQPRNSFSHSSTSQNQNTSETTKSSDATLVAKSRSKIATQPLNDSSSENTPEIIMLDVEKSTKGRSAKALNTPEIIIIDSRKHAKRRRAKAKSKNAPEIITIDDEDNVEQNLTNPNASLNKSDTQNNAIEKPESDISVGIISSVNKSEVKIDATKSAKKILANINTSINKFDSRNNVQKIGEGSREVEASTSVSIMNNDPCSTNKTQEQSETSIHKHHLSSSENNNISSNLIRVQISKPSNYDGAEISSLKPSTKKSFKNKKKKKLKKKRNRVGSNSLETSVSNLNSESCSANKIQEQYSSSVNTSTNSSNANCKENKQTFQNQSNKKHLKSESSSENGSNNMQSDTICNESQALDDTSGLKLISFLTEHCTKLASELNRIKSSEFGKFRNTFNLLYYNLKNINLSHIPNEYFFQHVHSLIDYFSDPQKVDMPTVIYLIVDYLSHNTASPESLFTYTLNQDVCVYLQASENCIVHALFEVERRALPHLYGLIRNTLKIINQVLISKKNLSPNGLASLCRVYMEICKCYSDRWGPLSLCCELLKLEHPLAPYLINCLAAVWRAPFYLHDKFSVAENMLLGSIHYGMKDKPSLMDSNLWTLTVSLRCTYFPRPLIISSLHAIQFLKTEIVSRCEAGLFQNIWMLTSPFIIYASKESRGWKKGFRFGYLGPKLRRFARTSNEQGFGLFCNLFVDFLSLCNEDPSQHMLKYFANEEFHEGKKFVKDCAATALLKYMGIADKPISAPLRDWFIENQYDPKMIILTHLYCIKVMESEDNIIKWDDIIIV